jgi:hypothetical protein
MNLLLFRAVIASAGLLAAAMINIDVSEVVCHDEESEHQIQRKIHGKEEGEEEEERKVKLLESRQQKLANNAAAFTERMRVAEERHVQRSVAYRENNGNTVKLSSTPHLQRLAIMLSSDKLTETNAEAETTQMN